MFARLAVAAAFAGVIGVVPAPGSPAPRLLAWQEKGAAVTGLAGGTASTTALRFRLVAAGFRSHPPNNNARPTVRLARKARERIAFVEWVPAAADAVMTVDLHSNFVVGVFTGWRPTSGYAIKVDRVSFVRLSSTRRQLCIVATESRPSPDEGVVHEITAPFAVVAVRRIRSLRPDVPRLWVLRDASGTALAAAPGAQTTRCVGQ